MSPKSFAQLIALRKEWEEAAKMEGKPIHTMNTNFALLFFDIVNCLDLDHEQRCEVLGVHPLTQLEVAL